MIIVTLDEANKGTLRSSVLTSQNENHSTQGQQDYKDYPLLRKLYPDSGGKEGMHFGVAGTH